MVRKKKQEIITIEKKLDPWKLATIFLIGIVIAEVGFLVYDNFLYEKYFKQSYDLGLFEIDKKTVDDIASNFGKEPFSICNSKGECVVMKITPLHKGYMK